MIDLQHSTAQGAIGRTACLLDASREVFLGQKPVRRQLQLGALVLLLSAQPSTLSCVDRQTRNWHTNRLGHQLPHSDTLSRSWSASTLCTAEIHRNIYPYIFLHLKGSLRETGWSCTMADQPANICTKARSYIDCVETEDIHYKCSLRLHQITSLDQPYQNLVPSGFRTTQEESLLIRGDKYQVMPRDI